MHRVATSGQILVLDRICDGATNAFAASGIALERCLDAVQLYDHGITWDDVCDGVVHSPHDWLLFSRLRAAHFEEYHLVLAARFDDEREPLVRSLMRTDRSGILLGSICPPDRGLVGVLELACKEANRALSLAERKARRGPV